MSDVNANINIDINSSQAIAGLRNLEAQINRFQRTVTNANAAGVSSLNKGLVDSINATNLFNSKMVDATSSSKRFSDALDKGKLSLGQYVSYASSQMPGMSRVFKREFDTIQQVAETRVRAINSQYIALGKTVDGVTKAIKSTPMGVSEGYSGNLAVATQRQQMFNKLIDDGSTKLLNWGKNTQWAGRQLMVGFSLPLAALGTVASQTFMEIDKANLALRRVYGDLSTTTEEINTNVDAIKALGAEYTKYGIALSETITIAGRAAATGATNEKLLAETEQTLRFATLGQIDYNTALDSTIALQTAFGVSNEDLAKKIDFLNAVENQTILTIEDMSIAIPRVATVVKGLGGDVEDLAIMMTAMREGGVSAENAANGLKSGLASLINPTKRATESLSSMGINIQQIINNNKGDLMGLIKDFANATNALDEFSRQQVFEQVFGKYQYARMSALFTNITKDAGQAARAMELAGRSAQDLAAISKKELDAISDTTTVKFQAAMEQLKISIAPLGEAFLKGITPIVELVTKVAEAFNNLPDGVKNSIAVITGLVGGLGPILLMTIGLVGNGIANLVKAFQFFRKTIARLKGDASAFQYMATAELEALVATERLEGGAIQLTRSLNLQKNAVDALTTSYTRFAQAAGIAGGAMSNVAGRPVPGGRPLPPPVRRNRGGSIPYLSGGGSSTVPGVGNTDTVPAMLTPGEFVVNKQSTRENLPLLHAINDGNIAKLNGGGLARFKSLFKRKDRKSPGSYIAFRAKLGFSRIHDVLGSKKSSERTFANAIVSSGSQALGYDNAITFGRNRRIPEVFRQIHSSHIDTPSRSERKRMKKEQGEDYEKEWEAKNVRYTSGIENVYLEDVFSKIENNPKIRKKIELELSRSRSKNKERQISLFNKLVEGTRHPSTKEEYEDLLNILKIVAPSFEKDHRFFYRVAALAGSAKLRLNGPEAIGLDSQLSQQLRDTDIYNILYGFGNQETMPTIADIADLNKDLFTDTTSGFMFNRNDGGIIPNIQRLMSGSIVRRPNQSRLQVARTAKGKELDNILYSRNSKGKLDIDAQTLFEIVRRKDLDEKQLSNIKKYFGKRIKTGIFGDFVDNQNGRKTRVSDPQLSTWRKIAKVLEDKGHKVFNKGGMIPGIQYRSGGGSIWNTLKLFESIEKNKRYPDFEGYSLRSGILRPGALNLPSGYLQMERYPDYSPEWVIQTLASQEGQSRTLMSMLGRSALHSIRTTGKLPQVSDDLSVHSGRIVENLARLGIIRDPRGSQTWQNTINRPEELLPRTGIDPSLHNPLSLEQELEGFNFIREILKRGRSQSRARSEEIDLSDLIEEVLKEQRLRSNIIGANKGGMIPGVQYKSKGGSLRFNELSLFEQYLPHTEKYNSEVYRLRSGILRPGAMQINASGYLSMMRSVDRYIPGFDKMPIDEQVAYLSALREGRMPTSASQQDPWGGLAKAEPWVIELLASEEGQSRTLMAMLGRAAGHSLKTTGQLPQASEDLSVHSGRMVKNLAELGIIRDPRTSDSHPNWINQPSDLLDGITIDPSAQRQLSPMEEMQGLEFIRAVLKRGRSQSRARSAELDLSDLIEEFLKQQSFGSNIIGANKGGMIPGLQKFINGGKVFGQMLGIGGPTYDSPTSSTPIVPGVGNTDTVPAMLTPGEFVINKQSTKQNLPLLHAINNGIRMNRGGKVPGVQYFVEGGQPRPPSANQKRPERIEQGHGQRPRPATSEELEQLRQLMIATTNLNNPDPERLAWAEATGADLFTNWVLGIPGLANEQKMTGTEWKSMLNDQDLVNLVTTPLYSEIAQAMERSGVPDLATDPRTRRALNEYAQELGTRLGEYNSEYITDEMLATADEAVADTVLRRYQDFPELAAAIQDVRTTITTARPVIAGRTSIPRQPINTNIQSQVFSSQQAVSSYKGKTRNKRGLPEDFPLERIVSLEEQLRRTSRDISQSRRRTPATVLSNVPNASDIRELLATRGVQTDIDLAITKQNAEQRRIEKERQKRLQKERMQPGGRLISEQLAMKSIIAKDMEEAYAINDQMTTESQSEILSELQDMLPDDEEDERGRRRPRGRMQRALGKAGGLGMGMQMGAMLPGMMANEEGKFIGMDANMLSTGMMAGGTLLSFAPMLAGVSAGPMAAIAAAAAAAGAVAFALYKWRDSIDNANRESAKLASNIGGTANSLNTISSLFGQKTPVQRIAQLQIGAVNDQQQEEISQFQNVFQLEEGQKFIKDLENVTSAQRFQKLSDYLKSAIASGLMDQQMAQSFAKAVGLQLSDVVLSSSVIKSISNQEQGTAAMIDLAKSRERAVISSGNIAGLQGGRLIPGAQPGDPNRRIIDSKIASAAIGSSIQVIQDFSNAAALAKEEFLSGKISYSEYKSAIDQATEAQTKYTGAIETALNKTDDFGGTMQAIKDQLTLAGFSPEQQAIIEQSAAPNKVGLFGLGDPGRAAREFSNKLYAESIKAISSGVAPGNVVATNEAIKVEGTRASKIYAQTGNYELSTLGLNLSAGNVVGLENVVKKEGETTAQYNARRRKIEAGRDAYMGAATKFTQAGFSGTDFQSIASLINPDNLSKFFSKIQEMSKEQIGKVVQESTKLSGLVGAEGQEQIINILLKTEENGKPVDLDKRLQEITKNVEEILNKIPDDVQKQLNIDITSPASIDEWGPRAEQLKNLSIILDQLPEGVREIAIDMMVDENGKPLTAESFGKKARTLKKTYEDLASGNKVVKKKAIISLLQQVENSSGQILSEEEASKAYDDLVEKFGEAKILNLPKDVLTKVIQLEVSLENVDDAINALQAAQALAGDDPKKAAAYQRQIEILKATKKNITNEQKAVVEGGTLLDKEKTGGGGGAESPLKGFVSNILDQVKMWMDAGATLKDLNNLKGAFAKEVIKGQGIFDKLKGVKGITGTQLQEILGMGPEGANDFIKKYTKDGKLTKEGRALLTAQTRAGARETIGANIITARIQQDQVNAGRIARRAGSSKEVMSSIMEDPNKASRLVQLQRDINNGVKGAAKAKKDFLESEQKTVDNQKKIEEMQDPIGTAVEKITKEHEKTVKVLDDQIKKQEDIVEGIQDEIDELEKKNDADQWAIRNKSREKELIDRQIESLERANEMDRRRIETLERQDEVRNREADALSHELEAMSDLENKIRETYQERIDALDKVTQLNDHILEQEKQRLGLSQALSQGDIYAATAAAQEMRQTQAGFAQQQLRSGLEQGMENAVSGLRTSEGLTREQAEARIKTIKDQSYQTSLLVRDIEDAIYARNQAMIPLKDQQYQIDLQIRDLADQIFARETDIYNKRTEQLDPATKILENLNDSKIAAQQITDETITQIEALADSEMGVNEVTKKVDELANAWTNVGNAIAMANQKAIDRNRTETGDYPKPRAGETSAEYKARVDKWLSKKAEIEAERKKSIENAYAEGNSAMANMYKGGKIKKYAAGNVVGSGSRDSVNAMLTPGEFVVRKAMVGKYGIPMLNAINQGAFSMPKYNVSESTAGNVSVKTQNTSNIISPMYNNYSVNVSVSNTNASADEIANRTITKIKQMQNMQIRSGRGY